MYDQEFFPASFRLAGCSVFSEAAGLLSALAALEELLLTEEEAALWLILPELLAGLPEPEGELLPEADALPVEDDELSALPEDAELASVLPEEDSALPEDESTFPDVLPEAVLSALLEAEEFEELLVLSVLLLAEELAELLVELLSALLLAEEDALPEDAEEALDEELEDALSELDELLLVEPDSLSAPVELLEDATPLTVTSSALLVTVQSL